MKKLIIVITVEVTFINFKLGILMDEVSQQFDGITIYSGLAQSAYQNWLPSHSAIKVL